MQGIARALPEIMPGKSAGQGLSDTNQEGLERHSDTEEVTESTRIQDARLTHVLP